MTLTYDKFVKLLEAFRPTAYYGISEFVEPGKVYFVKSGTPEQFFVCHPDDFDAIKADHPLWKFVHLRERTVLTRAST